MNKKLETDFITGVILVKTSTTTTIIDTDMKYWI